MSKSFVGQERTKSRTYVLSRSNDRGSGVNTLKLICCFALLILNSCSALTEGRFVTRDGKPSPFQPQTREMYEPPREPHFR